MQRRFNLKAGWHGAIAACTVLGLLGAVQGASAKVSSTLQGQSKGSTTWIGNNLSGWHDLDYIPMRVYLTGGPASGEAIRVYFEHFHSGNPGVEDLTAFITSPNVVFTSGPTLLAPAGSDTWYYDFTINLTDKSPGYVQFLGRLSAGAHLNTGASLHLGGTPSLSTLQIFKAAKASGSPDLALHKHGPAQALPRTLVTYTIDYTNSLTAATGATGAQVTDFLPPTLTYVANSGGSNATLVGNTLFWDLGDLARGGSGSVAFQAMVNSNAANGQTITNSAQIYSGETDANYGDNFSQVITTVVFNRAPVANNDGYTVNEDTLLSVAGPGVLANDTDADGDRLSALLVGLPGHGSLSFSTNGGFVYTPAPNYNGTDSFTYKANDGLKDSLPATVTITVLPVNDAPVAANDAYTVNEDTVLAVTAPGVLANDTDVDGNTLTAVLVGGPAHGTLTLNADGSFRYLGATNYNGIDSFTYKANDGLADSLPATVTITVLPVNDAPVAINDAYTINEDTILTVTAPGVLANDLDVDGDHLNALIVDLPLHGSLSFSTNGGFIYTPAANYNGTDSFTYRASDGQAQSGVATVNITILPVNDPPVALADSYSVNEDTLLTVAAPGVLANDTDVDGNVLTAILVSGPVHGTLTFRADGSFAYLGATNFSGADTFVYKANDGLTDSLPATVTIAVLPVNDAPVAVEDSYSVDEDTLLSIAAPGVLGNDSDVDGDSLTAILVTGPAHGSLTLNADGSFRYLPSTNYNGLDTFSYKANDGALDSAPVTVSIVVQPVDDPPVARDIAYTVYEDSVLSIPAPGVLAVDSEFDGHPLLALLVTGFLRGNLAWSESGGFVYTPNPDFNGVDTLTYRARSGTLDSGLATVTITVIPVNDPPSFTKGPDQLVNQDAGAQSIANWATSLSAGPPDEAGQTLNFVVNNDTNALFSVQPAIGPAGTLTYTPAPHAYGVAHLTVVLKDDGGTANGGNDTSAPQTFTITVNAPPTVEIIEPTNQTIFIAPANITIVAQAHDVDGTISEARILQGTNLLLQTNTAPYLTTWTNVMAGTYQFIAEATDNLGATGTSSPVKVTVLDRPPMQVIQAPRFNPQTGLFEELVRVFNPTPVTLTAVRVLASNLPAGVKMFNASGTTNGVAYAQLNQSILPGGSGDLTIEYYAAVYQTPTPTLAAEVTGTSVSGASVGVSYVPVTRQVRLPNGQFLLEFSSLAGRIYFVQYSADLKRWQTAWPSVLGTSNRIQWLDNGPPRTENSPVGQPCRFYRVVLAP